MRARSSTRASARPSESELVSDTAAMLASQVQFQVVRIVLNGTWLVGPLSILRTTTALSDGDENGESEEEEAVLLDVSERAMP